MTDPQVILNLGTGGSDLNGQNGSTSSADSNDARLLEWPGDNGGNYVYLSDVPLNRLWLTAADVPSLPDDLEIVMHVALDTYTPASSAILIQHGSGITNFGYRLYVWDDGDLRLYVRDSTNTTTYNARSTVSLTTADGDPMWIKVTKTAATGAVRFYTSSDGSSYTQLGADVSLGYTGSAHDISDDMRINGRATTSDYFSGKVYYVSVGGTIGGAADLVIDCSAITSGSATSFLAAGGETVNIERSTAGRKSVAVVSPVWLFGTDDYMEVSDNDLLDFDATDSFTVLAVVRQWATPASYRGYASKYDNSISAGYRLQVSSTLPSHRGFVGDSTNSANATRLSVTEGSLYCVAATVDRSAGTLTVTNNDGESSTSISSIGSLSTSVGFFIGRQHAADSVSQDFEGTAFAVFRRALTDTEISALTDYYQARLS